MHQTICFVCVCVCVCVCACEGRGASYLLVPISKVQRLPWHLSEVLLPRLVISVGAHKNDVKVVGIGTLLDLLVPLCQLRGKRPANLVKGGRGLQIIINLVSILGSIVECRARGGGGFIGIDQRLILFKRNIPARWTPMRGEVEADHGAFLLEAGHRGR